MLNDKKDVNTLADFVHIPHCKDLSKYPCQFRVEGQSDITL